MIEAGVLGKESWASIPTVHTHPNLECQTEALARPSSPHSWHESLVRCDSGGKARTLGHAGPRPVCPLRPGTSASVPLAKETGWRDTDASSLSLAFPAAQAFPQLGQPQAQLGCGCPAAQPRIALLHTAESSEY